MSNIDKVDIQKYFHDNLMWKVPASDQNSQIVHHIVDKLNEVIEAINKLNSKKGLKEGK